MSGRRKLRQRSRRGRLRLDRRCPAPRRHAPGRRALELRRQAGVTRSYSGRASRPQNAADGARSSVSSTTPGEKLKIGAGDTLFAYVYIDLASPPSELMLQWHTAGRLVAPRLLGRERDRLGQGRHARTAADGRPAGGRPVGAAGGAGRQAQAAAGHDDRRLGVHPARRHGLLGQGRHRDSDPAGRPALRLAHGLGFAAQRPLAARVCRRTSRRSSRSNDRGGPRPQARELASLLHRARLHQDHRGARAAASQARRRPSSSGKQLDEQLPTTLVFREKAGEPRPAFLLKRGEYDQRGEKVGRGGAGVLAAAAAGRTGQPPGTGPAGWSRPTIR